MRQQQPKRNIWMVHSAQDIALKKRWQNLFAISAVTVVAFISIGLAIWQTSFTVSQSMI